MGNTLQNYEELRDNNKLKEGLKTATKLELLFLMASFFQNSLINCDFSLRYEIAFSAIQKLKLFSLLKIKEKDCMFICLGMSTIFKCVQRAIQFFLFAE